MLIIEYADTDEFGEDTVALLKSRFNSGGLIDNTLLKTNEKSRLESLAALFALSKALDKSGHSGSAEILTAKSGKKYFKSIPLHFSLAHSNGKAVCALCDREVGVDIEYFGNKRNFDALANRFFSDNELDEYYGSFQRAEMFYRIWTAKESVLKMKGSGLDSIDLKMLDTVGFPGISTLIDKSACYIVTVCEKV